MGRWLWLCAAIALCAGAIDADASHAQATAGSRVLYQRRERWRDHATLLAAAELAHPVTALAVLPALPPLHPGARRGGRGIAAGGFILVGDAAGTLHVLSPQGDSLGWLQTGTPAAVTAVAQFAAHNASCMLATGHASGEIRVHSMRLVHGDGSGQQAELHMVHAIASNEVLCTPSAVNGACPAIVRLDSAATMRHARRAVLAVVDAAGRVAAAQWGHPTAQMLSVQELPGGNETQRAVAAKAHPTGVSVVLEGGLVHWRPLRPKAQQRAALACQGLPAGGVVVAAYDAVMPGKLHVITAAGAWASLTGALGAGQRCTVVSTARLSSGAAALALAAVPGYLFAVLTPGNLALVNVSSQAGRSAATPLVLQDSLLDLGEAFELPGDKAFAAADLGQSCNASVLHPTAPPPLLAAAAAAAAPGVPGSDVLVALQLGPRVVAVYAAVLPYRSPAPAGTTPLAWLKIIQPLMLAGVVAVAVARARRKSQGAAAVKSMEQLAHSLGTGAARPRWAAERQRTERRGRQIAAEFGSDGSDDVLCELDRVWNQGAGGEEDDGGSSGDDGDAALLLPPVGDLTLGS